MNQAAGLTTAQAGLCPPQELPCALVQLIELAVSVATVDVFGRDLNGPGRANARNGLLEIEIGVVHLNSEIAAVGDIHEALLGIHGDGVYGVELVRAGAASADRFDPRAVLAQLDDARVVVSISDEDVVLRVPGQIR